MKSVFIGAGHSFSDPGAVSADGKLREATLVLQLRDKVGMILLDRGIPFRMDGPAGTNRPLRDSIAIAKTCDGPRVELHFNAGPPTAKGVECLSLPQHKVLAQKLALAISRNTGSPLRGILGWRSDTEGQHHRLAFCREGGGIVVEVEFISNPARMARYLAVRDQIAMNLADVLGEAAGVTQPLPVPILT